MNFLMSNATAIAAFICGAAAIYVVIRRTQKRRSE